MQTAKRQVRFTYQDYLHIPGDKRYEIINGDLHMTPAPLITHQKVVANLVRALDRFIEEKKLGKLLFAPVDIVLSEEDVVQPDILFITQERLDILTDKNVRGAPDLVVEVLSPSTREWDREFKRKLYEKFGVREYWIVDLSAQSIEVLQMTDAGFKTTRVYTQGTHLASPLLKNFSLAIGDVF